LGIFDSTEKRVIYHDDTKNTEKMMVVHGEKISELLHFLLRVPQRLRSEAFSDDLSVLLDFDH